MMTERSVSTRTLKGKTILVTRPEGQSSEFLHLLKEHGADVVHCPTIEIAPPDSWEECDAAVANLERYDGILFTSSNAAQYFLERLAKNSGGAVSRRIGRKLLYAVGSRTAEVVSLFGVSPTVIDGTSTSRKLAEALVTVGLRHLLFPKGNLAGTEAAGILRQRGILVDEIVVYRTNKPHQENTAEIGSALLDEKIDLLTFFSPSSFTNFSEMVPFEILSSTPIAAIGPTTAAAVREAGLEVSIMAAEPSSEEMVNAILSYFEHKG